MDLCDIQQIKALLSRHGFSLLQVHGAEFSGGGLGAPGYCGGIRRLPSCGVLEVGGIGPSPRSSPGGPGEWSLWNWTGPSSPSCQRPWPAGRKMWRSFQETS